MKTVSADTNLFLHALDPASQRHEAAARFLAGMGEDDPFVVCELVLVELCVLLRNPAVPTRPLDGEGAADVGARLRSNPRWQHVDYEKEVSESLWRRAGDTTSGFRRIIDARLASTLLHHGVTDLATANEKDFREFGFRRVGNPLDRNPSPDTFRSGEHLVRLPPRRQCLAPLARPGSGQTNSLQESVARPFREISR